MTETSEPTPLQHVVLLSFPEDLTSADQDELFGHVHSWPHEIGTMSECRIGATIAGERSRGYQYLLHLVFPSAEALADYVAHPVHQRLVRFLDERKCQRLAIDYYLDESTDAMLSTDAR